MWKYTELVYFLSSLYFRQDDILSLVIKANIKPQFLNLSTKAVVLWTNILTYAEDKGKVGDILKIVLMDGHSDNEYLRHFLKNNETTFKSPYSNRDVQSIPLPSTLQLEQLTAGQSTILPISFLENGLVKSRSIVRIVTKTSLGSGFVVANGYIITNNHVIDSIETASGAKIQFNYQTSLTGQLLKFEELMLDPTSNNGFHTSITNDWTIVKIRDYETSHLSNYGYLELSEVTVLGNEYVNIIQHPGGEDKKIALYHNLVVASNLTRIQYLTDTLPGSSGSPVFNSDWRVLALHHASAVRNSSIVNQGININLIITELKTHGFL